ncbi:MAG TPA: TonB-dependent receptor [Solimonas sp.]
MAGIGSLLMLAVTASWIAARQSRQRHGDGLEWALFSVLPAATALLLFLESGDTATALSLWLGHLALATLALVAWSLQTAAPQRRPGWTMVSVAVLAAGLLWTPAWAQNDDVKTEQAASAEAPAYDAPADDIANDASDPAAGDTAGDTPDDTNLDSITVADENLPADELPARDSAPVQLDTLIVTGEKLGRSLNETATSVGIVTRADLQASSDAVMKDVVTQFANVVSAAGDREIAIRGVPQSGVGGEGETISVYLDGVALPARAASFAGPLSAWDLEQVEVLRGAQSTNLGRSSLAGAVMLRSRAPTADWDLRLRAGAMSRDGHDYAFAGGGPLTETLRFRIAGQDRYDNGDIRNLTRNEDDAGREITRNLRAKLAWLPEALPGYRVQYGYTRANNEFGDPLRDASQGPRTETSNVRGNEDDISTLHSLEQSADLGDGWRLDAISGWSTIDNLYTIDYDRSAADNGYSDNTVDERVFSQELRVHYSGARLRAVAGLYYADTDKQTGTTGYDVAAAGGLALLNGTIVSDSTLRTQALFAEADWDFAERWRLTVGARLNEERSQRTDVSDLDLTLAVPADYLLSFVPVPLPPALVEQLTALPIGVPLPDAASDLLAQALPNFVPPDYEARDRRRFKDLLPKLGLTWFAGEETTFALSYQEGYRSGGTSVSFFGGNVSPFDPEYTKTVELALRSRWLDQRLTFNANLFYTRWRDQQVTVGESSGFQTNTENAGRSHYYGLEAETLWKLTGPLELFATLGLLRSEFDEFANGDEDYAGNEFPYAPRYTGGLGLTLREWHRLSGQLAFTQIGPVYGDADNDPLSRADARQLLNAKISYRLGGGFTLSLYGRNLLDDINRQGNLVQPGTEPTTLPGTDIVISPGRDARIASRYGEARSVGAVLEWQL